jgi:hypothetical protein
VDEVKKALVGVWRLCPDEATSKGWQLSSAALQFTADTPGRMYLLVTDKDGGFRRLEPFSAFRVFPSGRLGFGDIVQDPAKARANGFYDKDAIGQERDVTFYDGPARLRFTNVYSVGYSFFPDGPGVPPSFEADPHLKYVRYEVPVRAATRPSYE